MRRTFSEINCKSKGNSRKFRRPSSLSVCAYLQSFLLPLLLLFVAHSSIVFERLEARSGKTLVKFKYAKMGLLLVWCSRSTPLLLFIFHLIIIIGTQRVCLRLGEWERRNRVPSYAVASLLDSASCIFLLGARFKRADLIFVSLIIPFCPCSVSEPPMRF